MKLDGRLILLGVTGSIAAYKSAELSRALTAAGGDVQTLLSRSASAFIGALTLETLTRRRPMTDPLELLPDQRIGHIVAADSADAVIVAPATARWLAAMAAGLADDVITATCLATAAPVVVAPAMDGEMWNHPATRRNIETLRGFGYTIVEPESGSLASGQSGVGRLAEPVTILAALEKVLEGRPIRQPDPAQRPPVAMPPPASDLAGWHVVVTAGGTAEAIDPVRYVGNRSTGKMGVAIAQAALDRGALVTLIAGLTSAPIPSGVSLLRATSAAEMREAVLAALPDADALVMAAAVADFRPTKTSRTKIARDGAGLTLELEPTSDILAEAVQTARATPGRQPVIVGFAAETGSLARAPGKAAKKGVDLMVANDVAQDGSGFGADTNKVTVIEPGGPTEEWPLMSKRQVADRLLDRVIGLRGAKGAELAAR
ncbi:MAG: phosphopantothenoylcysteine decarboxylase / phosphopantothenate---cysteine ligase [Chloroflexota bacterium]|jgi:phosphopantothenoylcysteine decarboxylase/phosphopantothenate--cysteine ligase|nr:phosphopantothenoylcysteine decarboxylase / phosphopantothenate---cysteine ligase [Chloroflexota bacterium]